MKCYINLKSLNSHVYFINLYWVLASWKGSLFVSFLAAEVGCTVRGPCKGRMTHEGQAVPWELSDPLWSG